MAGHYRTTVVGITITVGFGMTALRDTLYGRGIETAWHNSWRFLLWCTRQQVYTVHLWIKHGAINTCTQNFHVRIKVKYDSTRVYRTYTYVYLESLIIHYLCMQLFRMLVQVVSWFRVRSPAMEMV